MEKTELPKEIECTEVVGSATVLVTKILTLILIYTAKT